MLETAMHLSDKRKKLPQSQQLEVSSDVGRQFFHIHMARLKQG